MDAESLAYWMLVPWSMAVLLVLTKFSGRPPKAYIVGLMACGYGPLYSLVKFSVGGLSVTLGLVLAGIIMLLHIRDRFPPLVLAYLLAIGMAFAISLAFNDRTAVQMAKAIFVFSLVCSGVMVGAALQRNSMPSEDLKVYALLMGLMAGTVFLARLVFMGYLRDAGIAIIIASLSLFLILNRDKKSRFVGVLGIVYAIGTQTRTVYVAIILALLFSWPYLRARFGSLPSAVGGVITLIAVIGFTIQRTFFGAEDYGDMTGLEASSLTRLNAAFVEWSNFLESPLYGKGIYYFEDHWRLLFEGQKAGILDQFTYIAYNHVGVSSTLAQTGSFGFLLLICFPALVLVLALRRKPRFEGERLLIAGGMSFLFSFLLSGGPIRTDFPDMFWFYLIVGYFLSQELRLGRISKVISKGEES